MARFRDSHLAAEPAALPVQVVDARTIGGQARLIGEILQGTVGLTDEQIETVLATMRMNGGRFGETAVALGLVSTEDVLYALAQQFSYPYAAEPRRQSNPELVSLNSPFSSQAEALRAIRTQVISHILSSADRDSRRALAVVSPNSGDGKTFFSANLAISLAQLGGRTLIIDADLRGPRQHEVFGIENTAGLSTVLSGRSDGLVLHQVSGVPNFFVMPGGAVPPNPLELVSRPVFGILMRELTAKFDYVLVDTPAAVYGSDAQAIASSCGAALIVARKDKSRVSALQEQLAALSIGRAQLAGVILNEF